MIRPDKYTDLKYSIIGLSYLILKHIGNKYVKLDKVALDIFAETGDDARFNFIGAVNFLYMTGKLDYNVRRDSIKRGSGQVEDK